MYIEKTNPRICIDLDQSRNLDLMVILELHSNYKNTIFTPRFSHKYWL